MSVLSASEWGYLGVIERKALATWEKDGVDTHSALARASQAKLSKMATRLLKRNPAGGRPNKHDEKLFRSRRPEQERLMPHGFANWPAVAPQPY